MDISYQTPSSSGTKSLVRVNFDPPLSGYEEVKPRLLSMKANAEEALGMVMSMITPNQFLLMIVNLSCVPGFCPTDNQVHNDLSCVGRDRGVDDIPYLSHPLPALIQYGSILLIRWLLYSEPRR